jgi:hypothetical protein
VIKEIPERNVLYSDDCISERDGSNILTGWDDLFLNENEDVSHLEMLNSEGKIGF